MASAADFLQVPPGWDIAKTQVVGNINELPADAQVEIEQSADFYALSVFGLGDVIGNVPSVAQQLDQAAQQFGSRVYMVALLHTTEFNLLGIEVDRYRWLIVHSQFQALVVLVALPVIIGLIAVWLECKGQPPEQCGQILQTNAHDAAQAMCNIFGASCALGAVTGVLVAVSIASIAMAMGLWFFQSGLAAQYGIKAPALPGIPRPVGIQPPRISTTVGTPLGPEVKVATGSRGRRRGGGGLAA